MPGQKRLIRLVWSFLRRTAGRKILPTGQNFPQSETEVCFLPLVPSAWNSVTTGNMAGIDLWLDHARSGTLTVDSNIVSGKVDLAKLDHEAVAFDGGGLARQLSVYRLPEADWSSRVVLDHRDVRGRWRSAGLCARHAGRWPSSLVQPDLSDRLTRRGQQGLDRRRIAIEPLQHVPLIPAHAGIQIFLFLALDPLSRG
jgi:hypothetical protein